MLSADLMHSLWEADVLVFKAHITTSPAGKVADIFWIYDHRSELPDNHRYVHHLMQFLTAKDNISLKEALIASAV